VPDALNKSQRHAQKDMEDIINYYKIDDLLDLAERVGFNREVTREKLRENEEFIQRCYPEATKKQIIDIIYTI